PAGKAFTARYCDWYFTGAVTPEQVKAEIADVRARAAAYGREVRFITYIFVLCRDSEAQAQQEAEEILAKGDQEGARALIEGLTGQTVGTAASILGPGTSLEDMLRSTVLGVGSGKLIGTPEQVACRLAAFHEAGLDAVGLTCLHVEDEMVALLDQDMQLI